MRSIVFEGNTWGQYENLRTKNKVLHKNLGLILKEMQRGDPKVGIGKPEPLKRNLTGLWSRRLSIRDRVLYRFDPNSIFIYAVGGHYDQF